VVGGPSLGRLAATVAALRRPDVFGNVLSQSGAFNWRPTGERDRDWEWLRHEIERTARLPVRFWIDLGRLEKVPGFGAHPDADGPTLLHANRRLRDALRAKGYAVHYTEFAGGHDYVWWRGTLADGLLALLG
jgi:enterochelin esterase-like enzyme